MILYRITRVRWRCKSIDETFEDLPPFLTVEQVTKLLGISERTLWRILNSPENRNYFPRIYLKTRGSSHWRRAILTVGLLEYLQSRNFLNYPQEEANESKEKA